MTSVGIEVYRNLRVFLLVEPSEVQVVAVFPKAGWYHFKDSDLLFKRSFNTKKEAEAFLLEDNVKYEECKSEGASAFIQVVPKGYDRESEYSIIYRCTLVAPYKEDEPKFKNRKEAYHYDIQGKKRASLQIDTEKSFSNRSELERYLSETRQRFPDLGIREDKLTHPLKDKFLLYWPFALALVILGYFIGEP